MSDDDLMRAFFSSMLLSSDRPISDARESIEVGDRVRILAPDSPGFGTVRAVSREFDEPLVHVEHDAKQKVMAYGRCVLKRLGTDHAEQKETVHERCEWARTEGRFHREGQR